MVTSDSDFYKELLNDFKEEAVEHFQVIVSGLLEAEKTPPEEVNQELLETIFRETHSLKGAARAVDLKDIEDICMAMENVMHKIKDYTLGFSPDFFQVFFQALDILEVQVNDIEGEAKTISENQVNKLIAQLKLLEKGSSAKNTAKKILHKNTSGKTVKKFAKQKNKVEPLKAKPVASLISKENTESVPDIKKTEKPAVPDLKSADKSSAHDTIRVAIPKLYDILFASEEMITTKSILSYQVNRLDEICREVSTLKENLKGLAQRHESEATQYDDIFEAVNRIESDLSMSSEQVEKLSRTSNKNIDDLNFLVKKSLLQPISVLLSIIPRIVRDLSKEQDKDIALEISGDHIELDRRIIELMKDPIIHLVRNSIDHGFESKSERQQTNKPPTGTLKIEVSNETGHEVCIHIKDDGKGLWREKILQSAIKNGLTTKAKSEKLTDHEVYQYIFSSGVSTSPIITDLSGRGLGMAIVAEKIQGMHGSIHVNTNPGLETIFTIKIPQTISTFRGVLVHVSGSDFLIPTKFIKKALMVDGNAISTVENRNTITLDGETISLVSLANVLGLRKVSRSSKKDVHVLIVSFGDKKVGLSIDAVVGEFEGMIKPLGKQLQKVENVKGACFMGDGSIVPVLNPDELVSNASAVSEYAKDKKSDVSAPAEEEVKKVLVAEDSVTVRNMVRNHIESAGYEVTTAFDGQAAYEYLQKDYFDIVVSDIEMPRMNGFELTAKIRKDRKNSQIPVILVTSLDSIQDRNRGLESGANAYIVKSSFEKNNLIDTIKRLI